MKNISRELYKIVNDHYEKFYMIDEKLSSINLSDDKWSLKEIIGHLIDSASNNHQRIVRLQIDKEINFPAYHYDWIKTEKYNLMKYSDLILLWKQFNILISHLIENVDENELSNVWKIKNKEITLKELMIDYLRHLKEHIKHFEERLNELLKK